MGKLTVTLAVVLLFALTAPAATTFLPPVPTGLPAILGTPLSIWEAYSRGNVAISQVDVAIGGSSAPLGFAVTNAGATSVAIDEYVLLLSPNPRDVAVPVFTTQDGVLTKSAVPAGGTTTYMYGEYVAGGVLPGPSWWCTEERQYVHAGVGVTLGGEILPFDMETYVEHVVPGQTQTHLWDRLKLEPTLVVGKTVDDAFWEEIPEFPSSTLQVVLHATNLAIRDDSDPITTDPSAPNARVWDVVPPGYAIDLSSVTPGYTMTANPDGTRILSWVTSLPSAVVPEIAGEVPTPYQSATFSYRMTTPHISPGRTFLPRALISVQDDSVPEAHSERPVLDVYRVEVPPVADAGPGYAGLEGDAITFSAARSYDPNGDPVQFRWDFEADGMWDTPYSADPNATRTFGDDFVGRVRVEVSDGQMTDTDEADVVVRNVDPVLGETVLSLAGNLTLRVAGEKWHDVTMVLVVNGVPWTARVVRTPGSPDRQAATIAGLVLNLTDDVDLTIYYTPDDDPVNGQPNGANPVWVIFESGGAEVRLHHTCNVQHPETWVWHVEDALLTFASVGLRLDASASDVGSDDLTFEVDWGDGSTSSATVFNDGIGPDPYPSPDANPIAASASFRHAYASSGTYTVTITVRDDDGGIAVRTLDLTVG